MAQTQRTFNKVQLSELVSSDPGTAEVLLKGTPAPSDNDALVTWQYVKNLAGGLTPYDDCRAATTGPFDGASGDSGATIVANSNSTVTVDNVVLQINDRVLFRQGLDGDPDPDSSIYNAIYIVTATAGPGGNLSFARASDPSDAPVRGGYTIISEGKENRYHTYFIDTSDPIVPGTTAVTWDLLSTSGNVRYNSVVPTTVGMIPTYGSTTGQELTSSQLTILNQLGVGPRLSTTQDAIILTADQRVVADKPLYTSGVVGSCQLADNTSGTVDLGVGTGVALDMVQVTNDINDATPATLVIKLPNAIATGVRIISVSGIWGTADETLTVEFQDQAGSPLANVPDMVIDSASAEYFYRIAITPAKIMLV